MLIFPYFSAPASTTTFTPLVMGVVTHKQANNLNASPYNQLQTNNLNASPYNQLQLPLNVSSGILHGENSPSCDEKLVWCCQCNYVELLSVLDTVKQSNNNI